MQRPASEPGGGAGRAPKPPAPPFELLELNPIGKGSLLGRVRLKMPSGLIIACNVLRSKQDGQAVFVLPVGERRHDGGFAPIVDFATPELREAWQDSALAAVRPRLHELLDPTPKERSQYADF
jgi:hypothetical protein